MHLSKATFLLGCVAGGMSAAVIPLLLSTSRADTRLLPFQGRLTDVTGAAIPDGAKVVEFKIYDAPTGGNVKWAGEVHKLSVNGGLVNTMLGSKASLGTVDFSTPCYLQITIDVQAEGQAGNGVIDAADPPLLPRQSVVPAVYAAVAGQMQFIAPDANGKPIVAGAGWEAVFDNGNPNTGGLKSNRLSLAPTTASGEGAIMQNGQRLMHTFGQDNFFAGRDAGSLQATGVNNTGVGGRALQNIGSGNNNTAIGMQALRFNSTGENNTAAGVLALNSNTSGVNNTADGMMALYSNTIGNQNSAMGFQSLFNNTTGNENTAAGVHSLFNNTIGTYNAAFGRSALNQNIDGLYNVAVGAYSLSLNTSGHANVAVGTNALYANTLGHSNVAIGNGAGSSLTTGSNNIHISADGAAGESGTIRIGSNGTHTAAYVAGIIQNTIAEGSTVAVDAQGRLGISGPRSAVEGTSNKSGDVVYSLGSGLASYRNNPGVFVVVTGQELNITTRGGPVAINLTASEASTIGSYILVNGAATLEGAKFSLWRNGTKELCSFPVNSVGPNIQIPPGSISFLDTPPAGRHNYTLKVNYVGAGICQVINVRLVAVEY